MSGMCGIETEQRHSASSCLCKRDISRFQRLTPLGHLTWGLRPRLGYTAPLALGSVPLPDIVHKPEDT